MWPYLREVILSRKFDALKVPTDLQRVDSKKSESESITRISFSNGGAAKIWLTVRTTGSTTKLRLERSKVTGK